MNGHRTRAMIAGAAMAISLLGIPLPGNLPEARAAGRFELDLYRRGDFVAQTNLYQCVGASMQMMLNMIGSRDDRTAATQRRLWQLARTYSPPRPPDMPPRRGASVRGWAAGLTVLDVGPYRVVGFRSIGEAMRAAAHALRATGKPVGLLMWAGRHAWVMSGFRATADPRSSSGFRVTHVQVLDPLYPLGSSVWGRSPAPGTYLATTKLAEDFVPRGRGWTTALAGKYVIVMPVTPAVGAMRAGPVWITRPTPPGRPSDAGGSRLGSRPGVLQLQLAG
jgi:hypothetical protein